MLFGLFGRKKEKPSPKYYEWRIKNVVRETADTISVVFESPDNGNVPYRSGQFITLITCVDGEEVRRSYSLSSSPFVDDNLAITIKRVRGGKLSNYLLSTLKSGDKLRVMKPVGRFVLDYDKNARRHLILFAGGVGITPLISILKSILYQEPNSVVSLLYCNVSLDNIIFKKELDALQTTYVNRLYVVYALDKAPIEWKGYSGLLDQTMLLKFMKSIPNWEDDKTTYLMCGPGEMMTNAEALLKARNVPKENIRKESFMQRSDDKKLSKKRLQKTAPKARTVIIHYEGDEYKLNVDSDQTILDAALCQGVDLPFSCQSGMCTSCRGKLLSGKVRLDSGEGLSQAEREEGYTLTCVGYPLTDDVTIEID